MSQFESALGQAKCVQNRGIDTGPGKHINICPPIHKYVGQHEWAADMSGHVWFIQNGDMAPNTTFLLCVSSGFHYPNIRSVSVAELERRLMDRKKVNRKLLAGLAALIVKMDTTAGMSDSLWSAEGRQVLNAMAVVSQLKTPGR